MRALYRWDKNTRGFIEIPSRKDIREASESQAAMVLTDEIDPTPSPVNGEIFTSGAKLKRQIKAHGWELREGAKSVASDVTPNPEFNDEAYHRDVERAVNMVRYGDAPLTEYDKYRCEIINRQMKNRA